MAHWKAIVQQKQDERTARIQAASQRLLSTQDEESLPDEQYLSATAGQIVEHIQRGDPGWSAERVLTSFSKRAILSHEKTNCLTEVMISEALEEARELDRQFASSQKIKGPLHGVPISFKDIYQIKGYDNSIGCTGYCHEPSSEDADLVKQVRDAGGIPFVKTNIPQTLLAFECANPVFGRTTNPYSAEYICGGSSGGEAALLACDGSPLGFGSDIGGSLRIPTAFCGIYSLKPRHSRFSGTGDRDTMPGFEGLRTCKGPMGRSVNDVELACRLFFGKSSRLDEWMPPVPYRDVKLPKRLKFGYYKSDALIRASPPSQRAV
ncbi:hypothetical protein FRB94_001820 [Tulasnella sp. JGI-2019a]|nr:hypothetical protein FRB93_004295 [Tulasnella sp. JGI-2019a]KAG9005128.1 hypothetical protein FRB94_001820 [Tulasnella sp. JGI-2019a]KAG9028096.1 hypothetical protein FRB95_006860 [Tulasnella sp. JGI-2019a]